MFTLENTCIKSQPRSDPLIRLNLLGNKNKLLVYLLITKMRTYSMSKSHILIGVTGGIAAYKIAELIRLLRDQGHTVQIVMTEQAKQFITPLTLQTLSGRPVYSDLFDNHFENTIGHIQLARWAHAILIAPASADFIARLAYGLANDLLSTVCLASTAPILIAPAMNKQMWENQSTQANIALLKSRGVTFIGRAAGEQACGEIGMGRMVEPEELVVILNNSLNPPLFAGKKSVDYRWAYPRVY